MTASNAPIYILTHEFFPKKGGIATFTEEMARAAHTLGRRVEVWAPRGGADSEQPFPFPVKHLDLKGSQGLSCQLRLVRELVRERKRIRDGIVYLSEPGPVLAMRYLHFIKALTPKKLIITFHGSEIQKFSSNPAQRFFINQLIKRADRISTPSEYTHGLLASSFPACKRKTFLTPGALPSNFINPKAKNGKPSKKIHILTVGRLHPRKGQAVVLDALDALPRALRRQISFTIVGEGNKYGYEALLKDRAAKVDFAVTFRGDVNNAELQELYGEADIFAMTSVNFKKSVEGFGLVYLEAAANGLPIVAHNIGGVAEAVSHGNNGILVEPGNMPELTKAFAQLIENPDLRTKMGRNGRSWSRRNNWIQSADMLFNQWSIKIDPTLETDAPITPQLLAST